MSNRDLQHRDWVLRSQQALIADIAPIVSTSIQETPDGGKRLFINHVNESDIQKLLFLTNTDQNNNYMYLENFEIFTSNDIRPLYFPGLSQIMIKIFETTDLKGFIEGSKTQQPFVPSSFNGLTINEFIDVLSNYLPFVPNTSGKAKYYTLTLNPDFELLPS